KAELRVSRPAGEPIRSCGSKPSEDWIDRPVKRGDEAARRSSPSSCRRSTMARPGVRPERCLAGREPLMQEPEKSDSGIVAIKATNKAVLPSSCALPPD